VAIILTVLALIRKDAGLMVAAVFLLVPFAFARGSWSGFPLFVRLLPLFPLGSSIFISRDDPIFSWSLAVPVWGYLVYILFKILSGSI